MTPVLRTNFLNEGKSQSCIRLPGRRKWHVSWARKDRQHLSRRSWYNGEHPLEEGAGKHGACLRSREGSMWWDPVVCLVQGSSVSLLTWAGFFCGAALCNVGCLAPSRLLSTGRQKHHPPPSVISRNVSRHQMCPGDQNHPRFRATGLVGTVIGTVGKISGCVLAPGAGMSEDPLTSSFIPSPAVYWMPPTCQGPNDNMLTEYWKGKANVGLSLWRLEGSGPSAREFDDQGKHFIKSHDGSDGLRWIRAGSPAWSCLGSSRWGWWTPDPRQWRSQLMLSWFSNFIAQWRSGLYSPNLCIILSQIH